MNDLLIRESEAGARDALRRAKEEAGGPSGLSRALGGDPTSQAISQWDVVPAGRVLRVEAVTGVPRHELRPDLYPSPVKAKAAHAPVSRSRSRKVAAS